MINKVFLGNAHALKYVHEDPPRGRYKRNSDSATLNKGHLEGQATTQSCAVQKLEERRIKTQDVPNSKGSRVQLQQGDGPVAYRVIGRVDQVETVNGVERSVPPDPLPLWACYPPLLRDPLLAMVALTGFIIHITDAEQPSSQFGKDWPCEKLVPLAKKARKYLIKVLDSATHSARAPPLAVCTADSVHRVWHR